MKVQGKWCYLSRAIDRDGNLVDSMLSEKRDMNAAQRFFQQALKTVGHAPERVMTDGHSSYPRAIRETLGGEVLHQCHHYLNNLLEQDHRGIKQRYYPMRGFGSFTKKVIIAYCSVYPMSAQTRRDTGLLVFCLSWLLVMAEVDWRDVELELHVIMSQGPGMNGKSAGE